MLLLLVASTVLILRTFYSAAYPMDEGTLLAYPERILAGDVPNRDFEYFYGPANLWVLAAAFKLTSASIVTERIIGVGYRLILIAAVFWIGRRWGVVTGFSAGGVSAVCVAALGSSALAWMGGMAVATCAVGLAIEGLGRGKSGRWWYAGAGLAGGLALAFRPDLALAVASSLGIAAVTAASYLWRPTR